jgi:hypothetical protein
MMHHKRRRWLVHGGGAADNADIAFREQPGVLETKTDVEVAI